jgi:hypothetical protein
MQRVTTEGKDSAMHKIRAGMLGIAAIVALTSLPTAGFAAGPSEAEKRAACTGDAMRFCSRFFLRQDKIPGCLLGHRPQLSATCKALFDKYDPANSASRSLTTVEPSVSERAPTAAQPALPALPAETAAAVAQPASPAETPATVAQPASPAETPATVAQSASPAETAPLMPNMPIPMEAVMGNLPPPPMVMAMVMRNLPPPPMVMAMVVRHLPPPPPPIQVVMRKAMAKAMKHF